MPAQLRPAPPAVSADIVEQVVAVQRVVMEQQQPAHARSMRERQRISDRAMTPPDVGGILLVGVLAVVQQQGRLARQLEARHPFVGQLA
jgi:hypothetical protein